MVIIKAGNISSSFSWGTYQFQPGDKKYIYTDTVNGHYFVVVGGTEINAHIYKSLCFNHAVARFNQL